MSIYDTTGPKTGTATKKTVSVTFSGKKAAAPAKTPTKAPAKKAAAPKAAAEKNMTSTSTFYDPAKYKAGAALSATAKAAGADVAVNSLPASLPAGGGMKDFYKAGLAKGAAWAEPYRGMVDGSYDTMTPSQAYLAQALAQPFYTDNVTITEKAMKLYPDLVAKAKSYGIGVNVVKSVKEVGIAGKDYYNTSKGYNDTLDMQNQSNLNKATAAWRNIQGMGIVNPGVDYNLAGGGGYKAVWNEATQTHDLVPATSFDKTPITNERPHGTGTTSAQVREKNANKTKGGQATGSALSTTDAALRVLGTQARQRAANRSRFGG